MQTKGEIKKFSRQPCNTTSLSLYTVEFLIKKINCVSKHSDLNTKFIYVTSLSRKKINLHFYL